MGIADVDDEMMFGGADDVEQALKRDLDALIS